MNTDNILQEFLKYANYGGVASIQESPNTQSNLIPAPLVTGQRPPRTSIIQPNFSGDTNGNTVSKSVKPTTNTSKGLKI